MFEGRAREPIAAPIFEAVMTGTTGNQGISFVTVGRTVETPRVQAAAGNGNGPTAP